MCGSGHKLGKAQNMDPWSMDPFCGPGPWTGSIKILTGSMNPPFMDPLFFQVNCDLMTFDDTLRDGSSFGKPCISLTAHLPLKFMLNSSFFTFTGDFKAYSQILKSIIVLHLVFSLSWQHKYQHSRVDLCMVYCKQTQREYFR